MRFIELTLKNTKEKFHQNVNAISRLTEHDESTKITFTYGIPLKVIETKSQILGKIIDAISI